MMRQWARPVLNMTADLVGKIQKEIESDVFLADIPCARYLKELETQVISPEKIADLEEAVSLICRASDLIERHGFISTATQESVKKLDTPDFPLGEEIDDYRCF